MPRSTPIGILDAHHSCFLILEFSVFQEGPPIQTGRNSREWSKQDLAPLLTRGLPSYIFYLNCILVEVQGSTLSIGLQILDLVNACCNHVSRTIMTRKSCYEEATPDS